MTNTFDTEILSFFSELNTPVWLDLFMKIWTAYSTYLFVATAIVLVFIKPLRKSGIMGILATLLSIALIELVWKNIFTRVRPYEEFAFARLLVDPQTSWSFPSGHSSLAFACATALAFYKPYWVKISLFLCAALTAFSRVYVSVHYATDVIAGSLHGILTGIAAFFIVNAVYKKARIKHGING